MAKQLTVRFVLERETKGAVRYAEVDNNNQIVDLTDGTIGTLYIRKSALNGDGIPQSLTVTVTLN